MVQHALQGEVMDARDERIADLEAANRQLRADLSEAQHEVARVTRDSGRALSNLKRQLSPLYRALQAIFGELDAAGVADHGIDAGAPVNDRTKAVWDAWKNKLPSGCGKVIDALLVHGELNTQQLAIAVNMHRTSIPKLIYQLNQAGLITKAGGKFSLKKLS